MDYTITKELAYRGNYDGEDIPPTRHDYKDEYMYRLDHTPSGAMIVQGIKVKGDATKLRDMLAACGPAPDNAAFTALTPKLRAAMQEWKRWQLLRVAGRLDLAERTM